MDSSIIVDLIKVYLRYMKSEEKSSKICDL
jgi:hypothetical protein